MTDNLNAIAINKLLVVLCCECRDTMYNLFSQMVSTKRLSSFLSNGGNLNNVKFIFFNGSFETFCIFLRFSCTLKSLEFYEIHNLLEPPGGGRFWTKTRT